MNDYARRKKKGGKASTAHLSHNKRLVAAVQFTRKREELMLPQSSISPCQAPKRGSGNTLTEKREERASMVTKKSAISTGGKKNKPR